MDGKPQQALVRCFFVCMFFVCLFVGGGGEIVCLSVLEIFSNGSRI